MTLYLTVHFSAASRVRLKYLILCYNLRAGSKSEVCTLGMKREQGSKQNDDKAEELYLAWLLRVSKIQDTIGTVDGRTGLCHVSANLTVI